MSPRHRNETNFEWQYTDLSNSSTIINIEQPVKGQVHTEFTADHWAVCRDLDVIVYSRENLHHFRNSDQSLVSSVFKIVLVQGGKDVGQRYKINWKTQYK